MKIEKDLFLKASTAKTLSLNIFNIAILPYFCSPKK